MYLNQSNLLWVSYLPQKFNVLFFLQTSFSFPYVKYFCHISNFYLGIFFLCERPVFLNICLHVDTDMHVHIIFPYAYTAYMICICTHISHPCKKKTMKKIYRPVIYFAHVTGNTFVFGRVSPSNRHRGCTMRKMFKPVNS